MNKIHQLGGDDGRLLGRFHHNGISGHKRGGRHSGEDCQRKVPGSDHDGDPARTIVVAVFFAWEIGLLGFVEFAHLPGVIHAEIDGFGHIRIRLSPRLTAFEDDPSREIETPISHFGGDQFDVFTTMLGFNFRPGGKGIACGGNGFDGLIFGSEHDATEFFGRIARIDRDHRFSAFFPFTVDG